MPRVTTVEHARKDQGTCSSCRAEIKTGDPYRWWKFRFGPKYVRCGKSECSPKPSDLTQSEFYSTLLDLGSQLQSALDDFRGGGDGSDLASTLNDIAGSLRELGESCQEKLDNMPEGLQQGDTGQLLQSRVEECESKADELESAASTLESWEPEEEEDGTEVEGCRDDAASEADIDLSIS